MKDLAYKKLSMVGLLIFAISAMAAIRFQKKERNVPQECNGRLIFDFDGRLTCTVAGVDEIKNCHITETDDEMIVTTGTGSVDLYTTANPLWGCE